MWKEICLFELSYRLRRPETYAYAVAVFLFSLFSVDVVFEGRLGELSAASPYVIAFSMAATTALLLFIVSLVMGTPLLRDRSHGIEALLFVTPVGRHDFYLGRFLGSWLILLLLFSMMPLGLWAGSYMPWRAAETISMTEMIRAFCFFVLPTLLFTGSLFFVSGTLSRSIIVVYTQGLVVFILFHFGILLTLDGARPRLATWLDPFGFRALSVVTKAWDTAERNALELPLNGDLLLNRIGWSILGLVVLYVGFRRFRMRTEYAVGRGRRCKGKLNEAKSGRPRSWSVPQRLTDHVLDAIVSDSLTRMVHGALFYFGLVYRQRAFWGVVICAALIMFINGIRPGEVHGVRSLPLTYLVVEELQELSVPFFLLLLLVYSGQLVWAERERKVALITDSLPVGIGTEPLAKLLGLVLVYLPLLSALILVGVVYQALRGYHEYKPLTYLVGFFGEVLPFLLLYSVLAVGLQLLVARKYLAQVLTVIVFLGNETLAVSDWDNGLYRFGAGTLGMYSDMNGYAPFTRSYVWFQLYWWVFAALFFGITILFAVRGADSHWGSRLRSIRQRLTKHTAGLLVLGTVLFWGVGAYLYYRTSVIVSDFNPTEEAAYRADFERSLRPFADHLQPVITDISLNVELYPEQSSYVIEGEYRLKNPHLEPVTKVHVQRRLATAVSLDQVDFDRVVRIDSQFTSFGHRIYHLAEPLLPGDDLVLRFRQDFVPRGLSLDPELDLLANGTRFTSDHLPGIGYNEDYELQDDALREQYGLPPGGGRAKRNESLQLGRALSKGGGDRVSLNTIIGTAGDQTALTSGTLLKKWQTNDRAYFHYRTEQPILNFFAIVSASYTRRERIWNKTANAGDGVALQIYHHPGHDQNLDRMADAMDATLTYCTEAFGPYPYDHLRLVETPRYADYAQSLPGLVTCAETMGFNLEVDDSTAVDMAFFIVAHEVAHQWWGMQAVAANTRGRHLILEALAQYTALQVLRTRYPEEQAQSMLGYARHRYELGRTSASKPEVAPVDVDDEEYIYYYRSLGQFEQLRLRVGERAINQALRSFLKNWSLKNSTECQGRFATSEDLLGYLRGAVEAQAPGLVDSLFRHPG